MFLIKTYSDEYLICKTAEDLLDYTQHRGESIKYMRQVNFYEPKVVKEGDTITIEDKTLARSGEAIPLARTGEVE